MKSPIKNSLAHLGSVKELKKIIPSGKALNSFFFYCGSVELFLCGADRFVVGHTNNIAVHEFWECLMENPGLIHKIAVSPFFARLRHERILTLLQEKWATYKDPYIRAALFYTLNECSESGRVSSGALGDVSRLFGPWKLNALKKFKPSNFHLEALVARAPWEDVTPLSLTDYSLYNLGHYRHNLLESTPRLGLEESFVDHHKMHNFFMNTRSHRLILLYKNHPQVIKLYGKDSLLLIDKYGNRTASPQDCEEIIVTNF